MTTAPHSPAEPARLQPCDAAQPADPGTTVGARLAGALLPWFDAHARTLPWRPTTPWGVLVSEVMLQQTPVARVVPVWQEWQRRWPGPRDLATATPAEILRVWDRLGYPRRALRLRECAQVVVERHDGELPRSEAALRALPGVGEYTAAAVRAFAFGRRTVVLDTNVRRVLERVVGGGALPPPSLTAAERARAQALLPLADHTAAHWDIALMELGALVCTTSAPRCDQCPLRAECRWVAAGRPPDVHHERRRPQAWHGTDRQVRGRVMALLREASHPLTAAQIERALADAGALPRAEQRERALAGLLADGLATRSEQGYQLPG